jgi:hypothetical protein
VKSDLETLNPTRVKLTVEVPFEELKPSLDAAYKKIAAQVNIPGFRKGKVPPRVIDQRFGRAVVLEEAVNEALPRFYGQAVEDNSVKVLGQPEVDVTEFADGDKLTFTAEVDVRPSSTCRTTRASRSRLTTPRSPMPRSTSSSRGCATASPPSPGWTGPPPTETSCPSTCRPRSTARASRS